MKTFIKKSILFLIVSNIVILLIVIIPKYIIKNKATFKIDENITTVVFGHSHPECAYNDSIIADFKNLAHSGESYYYTFQKLKKLIPDNPQIKTVLIEFSNNQIDKNMDQWIWGYKKMVYFLPYYAPFINNEDYELLLNNNPKDIITCTSITSKKNLFRVIYNDYNYIDEVGGFKRLDVNEIDADLDRIKNNQDITNYNETSEIHLAYLRKIIDYCRNRDLDIYLTRSPQHKSYDHLANETLFQKIRAQDFSDVEFFDFNEFEIPDDYFADLGHLNYKGANKFSTMISNLFKKGLLESKNKQQLINEVMIK